jgi:uncharacterized membrane protein
MYNQYEAPTSLGIPERWERVLCYSLAWLSGLFFLIVEQRNQNVRRHAMQSVLVFGALSLAIAIVGFFGAVLGHIWFIGLLFSFSFGLVSIVLKVIGFALWVILMLMAWAQPRFVLPLGRAFERMIG